jgi:CRP/FNR family transcriptional regulator, cyclic AMP receptor protein
LAEATLDLIRRLALFRALDDDALTAVAERMVVRTHPAGTVLFRRGEPCRGLFVVLSGRVRVYRSTRDGREQVLHTQGPGQPLAEVPLFDGGPYPANAVTDGATRLAFLGIGDFQWLYRHQPAIADAVIGELGRRLRRMVALVETISLKDVPARVAVTLLQYAEAAGSLAPGARFRLPRTHEEMARELATTRESVARAFSRLRREGAIGGAGAEVVLLDLARLEAAAGR